MAGLHTILIVDDEPDVLKSVKDLLRLDYRVLEGGGAVAGLDIMRREPVDVVLCDQRMEGMTGVEFFKVVRDEFPAAIRLLFTGYADMCAVVDAINLGHVYRYIAKPWDTRELELIIRDACERFDLAAERTRLVGELKEKISELRECNALKSAFIKVAGHELRTPLAILLGLSKLAMSETGVPEPLSGYITGMDHAAERLERLVIQILKMLSAEKFDKILHREITELAPLLRRAAEDVAPFVRLRNQTIALDVADDLGHMDLDAEKVRDSVNQLLLNAIKFTPDKGRIDLTAKRNEMGLTISVSDTGGGIQPEHLPRLFEAFFTGFDVSTHSSGHYEHQKRGLGLGLSVVKAFAEMQGGKVDVESKIGEGSTFRMLLPAA